MTNRNVPLVCVDSSPYLEPCIQHALWLAKTTKADQLIVSHVSDVRCFDRPLVNDFGGAMGIQPFHGIVSELQKLDQHKVDNIRDRVTHVIQSEHPDLKWEFDHRVGIPSESISHFEGTVDAAIIGKRGDGCGYATEHLGSNLDRILRTINIPCLIASRQYRPIRNVLIAYDGSPSCERALDWLLSHPGMQDLDYQLIHVVEGSRPSEDAQTASSLDSATQRFRTAGFRAQSQLIDGEVEEVISRWVADNQTDLLILGACGKSRIRHLFLGSTTIALVRSCRIPVFTFR